MPIPLLLGLVLAGGESRRMGRDKGALVIGGEPQVRRAWRLLNRFCVGAYVSAREGQASEPAYAGLPLILDREAGLGPAAGLMAAWREHPEAAWLVLAADMPLVDAGLLAELIRGRDPERLATVFRQPEGWLQPLCAIWEPRACTALEARLAAGDGSLRRVLEGGPIAELAPSAPERLTGINTEDELRRVVASMLHNAPLAQAVRKSSPADP
ncbi:MAG TPA: NTP transferase domain-containing protein [Gammaproteobacteria bacterium]|nr:NTP transferase domain-containing protein [Gammaproteobacteria bacterium]